MEFGYAFSSKVLGGRSPAGGMAALPRIVIVTAFPGFSMCLLVASHCVFSTVALGVLCPASGMATILRIVFVADFPGFSV